ncbi:glutamate racemase [Pseudogulbenkiania subflava DSM 22618]|uniref:Glutamate racemase n=2 Tax=Pseudogulbenkiania subflava TaxID=451637 RepID=A0A1Y6BWU3_9NEIS|nr:glutamate racemase [Pseudogulbenkiania subflava DSM 22618]
MIGMFDSGLGGLSVWRELTRLLPQEPVIYLADRAYCPYGGRSHEDILARSEKITRYLVDQGARLIVIACNTATSAAARELRRRHPELPIVGMEPAVKPAALHSRSGQIAVLATRATLKGDKFLELKAQYDDSVDILPLPGDGFVELVESGDLASEQAQRVVERQLHPLRAHTVDQVVLGCTHYPFLSPLIERALPAGVKLIDPARAVSLQAERLLQRHGLSSPPGTVPDYRFVTTGEAPGMHHFLRQVLGHHAEVDTVDLDRLTAR